MIEFAQVHPIWFGIIWTVLACALAAAIGVILATVLPRLAKIWRALFPANPAAQDRAFVASRSSPQAVLTKGFNHISQGENQ
jgi:hypothetical protein